jgi:cysteine desulfurase/selenocysteine lyase
MSARARPTAVPPSFDVTARRRDFPILERVRADGKRLVYLDNAATSQRPESVLAAMDAFYRTSNANVHRGLHTLSEEATTAFEDARAGLARFINAPEPATCIFTRNTTEGLNLVACAWGRHSLRPGDEIVLTEMEHHSNIVPWQLAAESTGAVIRWVPVTPEGLLDLDALDHLLSERTKVVSVIHVSNVLGTVNPVKEIARRAHAAGAVVVADGAQAVPHLPVDVQDLDVDFYAFSGHKMCGPTGAGMLFGRRRIIEEMHPFQGGGEMIVRVTKEKTTFNRIPWRFEAGTPNIAEAIGMGAAAGYLQEVGLERIGAHERALAARAIAGLEQIEGLRVLGPRGQRAGLVTFHIPYLHPHDLATFLDQEFIAIRAGHHCAQVLHDVLRLPATARASFYLYNTPEEVDRLIAAVEQAADFFRP